MTPEGKVKERVKAILKKYGVYYHMPVMNGMGAPTLDFVSAPWGFFLAIETKAPGEKATARQQLTMQAMRESHGICLVVGSDEQSFTVLENTLRLLQSMYDERKYRVVLAHLELMGHGQATETDPRAGVRRAREDAEEAGARPRRRPRKGGAAAE